VKGTKNTSAVSTFPRRYWASFTVNDKNISSESVDTSHLHFCYAGLHYT
jgi:hypothetical protein